MMISAQHIIEDILYNYSFLELFILSFIYFLFLYFGIGSLFLIACKALARFKLLHKIIPGEVRKEQLVYEIRNSLVSIFIFGLSILPIIYLIRAEYISLKPNTTGNILIGLFLLTIWNEIHFYIVHRFMHIPIMMKKFHYIHHRSKTPTVYSVFSFHWLEATLLSTVPLTLLPFIPLSIVAVFIYPLVSILLNLAGHCNYRFGRGRGNKHLLIGTLHNEHHSRGRKNFGFALSILDILFSKNNQKK